VSVLFGRPERRSAVTFPSPPIPPNSQVQNLNYAHIDLSRTESSLQKVAVWSCVNLVATIAETLELQYFPRPRERQELPAWLADIGGDGYGTPDWSWSYIYSAMLRGNVYGTIADQDPRSGNPTQIVLQHPDTVQPYIGQGGSVQWHFGGQTVPAGQVWHKRLHTAPGQIVGLSPIALQALTIRTGITALQFGAQWFTDGAHPSGVLTTEQQLDQKKADTAKQRFMAAIHGRREPAVLGSGWKYQPIQISPNESQFLETNNFTSTECCRIFGPGFAEVLGYETGGSLTYSNIEQRSIDLLTYAVDPWLVRLERSLSALLPSPGARVKFDRSGLQRTDTLTRVKTQAIELQNRIKNVNQVRDESDLGPVAWGEEPNELVKPTTVGVLGGA
jgi:HK97 family phage portal protein